MPQGDDLLVTYLELARAARLRNRPWDRDKLLLLAGAAAAERGRHTVASLCKREILAHNAGHLIGHYGKIAEALTDERFSRYLNQLRRKYTPERCEHMLVSLGIDPAERRAKFVDLDEYVEATLLEQSDV
jgi:glycine/D-amino acid oxidase-like deaminating enzyme